MKTQVKQKMTKMIEKVIVKEETKNLMGFTEKLFCFSITEFALVVCVFEKEGIQVKRKWWRSS